MKSGLGFVGFFIGLFLGAFFENGAAVFICAIICCFVGRAIGNSMDEEKEAERRRREANEQQRLREENERRKREEEMRKRPYNELEQLRRDYPHAFVAICNECLGGVIYDSSINMPGERKSMRQKRHEDSYRSTHFSVTMSIYDTRKYYNKQYRPIGVDAYGQYPRDSVYGRMNSTARYYQEPKTVWALLPEDVNKILAQKSKFSGRERSILATLKSEEISIKYDDEILDIPKRAAHVKDFLIANGRKESDKEFAVNNISKLDCYISEIGSSRYEEIKRKYPGGLKVYESYNSRNKDSIIADEETIKNYDVNAKKFLSYIQWEGEQAEYARKSRSCSIKGYGCYSYDIEFKRITKDGKEKIGEYKVWQHFISSYFFDEFSELTGELAYLHENALRNTRFLNCVSSFTDTVYDKVFELIVKLKAELGDIVVIWGDSDFVEPHRINERHFGYLRCKLDGAGIGHFELDKVQASKLCRNIVIIELITENSSLRKTCRKLIEKYPNLKPLITYVSLSKGYDRTEVQGLIESQRKKREKEQQLERERKEKIEREKRLKEQLKNAITDGFTPTYTSIKCFSLYNYYPTTCDFEANDREWETRNLIWDFKANPNRPQSRVEIEVRHERAENVVVPLMVKVLRHFYNSNLAELTLICIPSSKQVVNERRYRTFSRRLCEETGMTNGFSCIKVAVDGEATHLGGTARAEYSIDENFVKGKNIILFDDVITSGKSMERVRSALTKLGANVVGGFSIGRTRHERQNSDPIDMLF